MPITRAKARQLLNQKEMALYDDSRINGLRQFDAKALAARVTRARTARDRARDLVQKHKLASRARTGSKRGASGVANQRSKDKAELLADILKRFETRARQAAREEKAAAGAARTAARKTAAKKKPPATKTATRRARTASAARPAGKPSTATGAPPTAPAKKRAAKKRAAVKSAAGTAAGKKTPASRNAAGGRPRKATRKRITPEQALAQTHTLLEAKRAHDSEPKPWQEAPDAAAVAGQPGFQSDSAARRARRLHAAEARIPAIQGSSSTRDRISQGKRDHRGDGED